MPPVPPSSNLFVRWVHGEAVLRVFDYDKDTHVFTPTEHAEGRIAFINEIDNLSILMNGEYAMFMDDSGVLAAGNFSASVIQSTPRIEFCWQIDSVPRVLLAIGINGVISARSFLESDTLPEGNEQFIFYDKISFGPTGVTAVTLNETSLLASGGGDYVSEQSGELIEGDT